MAAPLTLTLADSARRRRICDVDGVGGLRHRGDLRYAAHGRLFWGGRQAVQEDASLTRGRLARGGGAADARLADAARQRWICIETV